MILHKTLLTSRRRVVANKGFLLEFSPYYESSACYSLKDCKGSSLKKIMVKKF
jgi:hypothetical protein